MKKIFYSEVNDELSKVIFDQLPSYNKSKALQNFTFYEFSLEDLELPNAGVLLDSVLKIQKQVGIQAWNNKNKKALNYKGFSLTYNPNYQGDIDSIYHQTWGSQQLTQNFSRQHESNTTIKDTYYDTYGFRKIPPIIESNLGNFIDLFSIPILRSRVAFFNPIHPSKKDASLDDSWHKDETPEHLLRINIPLQTSPEHLIDIVGEDDVGNKFELIGKHFEVGKVYIWNTRIPHRIYINKSVSVFNPRIHMVLGFAPWINYNSDNDYFYQSKQFGINLDYLVKTKKFLQKFDTDDI
jgi:hypothetical protein